MIEHQKRVLDMLSEGKISVDEAERLMVAIVQAPNNQEQPSENNETRRRPLEQVSVRVQPNTEATSAKTRDDTFTVGASPTLVVDGYNGRIAVNPGPDNTIRVQATLRNPSRVDYQVSQDGDTVKVMARRRGKASLFGFLGNSGGVNIVVTTPRKTDVDLNTGNGRIDLNGVEGSSTLHTSNGGIVMDSVKGDLDASTSNSRIELSQMEGSAVLRTSNGRIVLDNVKGDFNAETSNGSIAFKGEMIQGGNNQLRTSNGGVSVKLEGTPSLTINASTSNGRVTSKLPVLTDSAGDRHRLVGTIGDGEAELLVQSSNGSVTIE